MMARTIEGSAAFCLAVLLLALPAAAQGIDVSVDVEGPERSATLRSTVAIHVRWNGSERAQNVVLEIDTPAEVTSLNLWDTRMTCGASDQRPIRCSMPALHRLDGALGLDFRAGRSGLVPVTARITSAAADPVPANNTDTHVITIAGLPSLTALASIDLRDTDSVDPGTPLVARIWAVNHGEPATDVVLRAALPDGGTFTSAPSDCTWTATEIVCRIDEQPQREQFVIVADLVAPGRTSGGTFPLTTAVDAAEDDYDPRDDVRTTEIRLRRALDVTSTEDDGAGSLRQAIVDSRALCATDPCTIRLRGGEIRPLTPLPELRGRVKIDGGADLTTLDGSLLERGGALRYETGCEFRVDRLVIRNFKGHAIEARQTREDWRDNRQCPSPAFGTPLTIANSRLVGNLRGIVTKGISATIADNVIRDHTRAGIFIDRSFYVDIHRNAITGNGASGVFVDVSPERLSSFAGGADIVGNRISGNGEFGVARTGHGLVGIVGNVIADNVLYGIDVGLDLDTPNRADDASSFSNKPVLFSASYVPSRGTVIRGRNDTSNAGGGVHVDFYASASLSVRGHPQAERHLTTSFGSGALEVVVPEDLRGRWITATNTRTHTLFFLRAPASESRGSTGGDTSELSNAVKVE